MSKINILSFFFLIVFFGCANTYKLQEKAVLNFSELSYSSWSSGVKGGGSGFNIFLKIDNLENNKTELKGVYFRGKYASLKLQGIGSYQAFFKQNSNSNSDKLEVDAHVDNKVEIIEEDKIPFVLSADEAVISYLDNKKLKYTKVVLTKKKRQRLDFPM